jgi:hypothetical protein
MGRSLRKAQKVDFFELDELTKDAIFRTFSVGWWGPAGSSCRSTFCSIYNLQKKTIHWPDLIKSTDMQVTFMFTNSERIIC